MAYKIRKMDRTGHSTIMAETPVEAVGVINEHLATGGFAQVGGQQYHNTRVTASDLEGVSDVFLSNQIVGGC